MALDALARLPHVHGESAHLHLEPDDADVGAHQHVVDGFRDDRRLRPVAARHAGERAVAGAFLLRHALDIDGGGRLVAEIAERVEGEDVGGDAGLHVAGAAAEEPVVLQMRVEGRMGPHVVRPGRHHVHMAVQHQGLALRLPGRVGADHVDGVVVIDRHRRETGMILDLRDVDRPAVHGVAALGKRVVEEFLRRMFLPAERGDRPPDRG